MIHGRTFHLLTVPSGAGTAVVTEVAPDPAGLSKADIHLQPLNSMPQSKSFKPLCFFCCLLFIIACAAPRKTDILTEHDPAEGVRKSYTVGNLVMSRAAVDGSFQEELYLNALRLDWRWGEVLFYLVVRYNSKTWLLIRTDKPLTLYVDGKRMLLAGEGAGAETRETIGSGDDMYFSEQARYELTPAQLRQIAAASKIAIRIQGRNHIQEAHLSPENILLLKRFAGKYGR